MIKHFDPTQDTIPSFVASFYKHDKKQCSFNSQQFFHEANILGFCYLSKHEIPGLDAIFENTNMSRYDNETCIESVDIYSEKYEMSITRGDISPYIKVESNLIKITEGNYAVLILI